ncbi:KpsF/GutQ family sugar-phosphate isomerase [Spiribacter roseus]|uniref:arabinose-5-phosphate isomerase n=1 Tax=Spiribacter roseus TaxID=1855875 RepID=A0ABV3RX76_9GAMM
MDSIKKQSSFVQQALLAFSETVRDIKLDENELNGALKLLLATRLPVVCSGVGKSGFIAAKFAATLNSLGIQAIYLNPTDALHGDLGIVASECVVIVISNSGSTDELRALVPWLVARRCEIICITSRRKSPLANVATVCLDYGPVNEIDEYELAPTTSTVVQLALSDALAAAASRARGLKEKDFLQNHPAGTLGKRLMQVDHLMRTGVRLPKVKNTSPVTEVLAVISEKLIGCTCVVDDHDRLLGLITDGDIRRALEGHVDIYRNRSESIMQCQPRTARLGTMVKDLIQEDDYFGRHFTIPVVDADRRLHGVIVSIDLI